MQLFIAFLRLGVTAFGGPTMVAYIGELSVKKHGWLDEETFKGGVALCQSIPGATAIQVAAYVGLKTKGLTGAVATYAGFALPAFFLMLLLSWAYTRFGDLPRVVSLFGGLQVVVVAVIANATYIFGRGALKGYRDIPVALASAAALWYGINPFYVILAAALLGMVLFKTPVPGTAQNAQQSGQGTARQLIVPITAVAAGMVCLFFTDQWLFYLALLMMKIDLFAFGGGFAAIPLMLQEVVTARGWIDGKTFMDGIALGQVTPGPIVITATFVGFLTGGLSGAVVATLAIFAPSFVLLVLGSHIFGMLQRSSLFHRCVKGIIASFVGLLLFVCIKFAFAVPWDIFRLMIAAGACAALLKRIDLLYVVLAGALISLLLL